MKNNILYKFLIVFCVMTIFLSFNMNVFAAKKGLPGNSVFEPHEAVDFGEVPAGSDYGTSTGSAGGTQGAGLMEIFGTNAPTASISDPEITKMASTVLGVIRYIGYAIAIGMVLYAGVKYMMSSANDKADLKNASIRLVIGALIVAAAATVFPMLWDIFFNISV